MVNPFTKMIGAAKSINAGTAARRVGAGAAYISGGYALSAGVANQAQMARAYYGETEYTRRFGDQFDRMGGMARTAGWIGGITAFLGKGPVSMMMTPFKDVGRLGRRMQLGAVSFSHARKLRKAYPGATSIRTSYRQALRDYKPGARAVALQDEAAFARSPTELARGYREARRAYRTYAKASPLWKNTAVLGTAALGGYTFSESLGGYGPAIVGGAVGLRLGVPMAKAAGRRPLLTGGIVGATAAGGMFGARTPMYASAEAGNISYRLNDEPSALSRMSFSTSGLVQSLHHNRRVQ
ncbi:MAG: hypothetical protein ACXABY_03845 [Candidatus Thorarchaeota archaeon]|jgi:hypothetical protein